MNHHLKLTYFDMAGRAEPTRLALTIAGVPFEDDRVSWGQWPSIKTTVPFHQLPVLHVDGQVLCQSHAIARYVGSLTGLYPEGNKLLACRVDEVSDYVEDIMRTIYATVHDKDPGNTKAMCTKLAAVTLPEMFGLLDARLADTGVNSPWFLSGMTVADLDVYCMVAFIKSKFLDHLPVNLCDDYPKIMGIFKAVASHPAVIAWNKAHTKVE
ncbi:hypothetical protein H310_02701 [Aphanomyces invadans]|uniref:Glutathione S-transferase n=1 Tax=Aphanomyces invadans TaxID=157072 RepID=A0A024UJW5_9STRA|nr:hypothetical protein H310_02701 [Aphanomyces invadans]ETW06445.1 hypothetical protein H310_02701 [Aphanomyces invadans]RHY33121.1 hypothetical protein DYB32_001965 [Aphanomyces invadans]|eukprot:XP_008864520.1 hypothetical protein H310_02701 [Aphanomyces invadans]